MLECYEPAVSLHILLQRSGPPSTSGQSSFCMGQQSPGSYSMFDREYEVALFEKLIQHTAPSNITMILGPRSSGKTTVLKHCIQRMKEGEFKPIYIDCRQRKMTDPAVLIKLLREQGAANAISLKGLSENKICVRLSQVLKTISG